jgi:geranylgeranyl diphosphate synthase type II
VDSKSRIEQSLARAIRHTQAGPDGTGPAGPALLSQAIRSAVFPGGARIRPRLCLAVAGACADDKPELALAAAASIELLHCASLVHDDLPCFDDAPTRRGKPSIHKAYGERIAVLTGDAIIVLAFQVLARAAAAAPARLGNLVMIISRAVGAPPGIAAGQAWECEAHIELAPYQRAKTGALFAAATAAGACAAGYDGSAWYLLGERIGEAYQIADDIRDVVSNEQELGKPTGRDQALGRPNAVHQLGVASAVARLEDLVRSAIDAMPDCPGAEGLKAHILAEASRLLPRQLARPAA